MTNATLDGHVRRIYHVIRNAGNAGISTSDICRRNTKVEWWLCIDILHGLVRVGAVTSEKVPPIIIYRATGRRA